jgi:hypothetical protein
VNKLSGMQHVEQAMIRVQQSKLISLKILNVHHLFLSQINTTTSIDSNNRDCPDFAGERFCLLLFHHCYYYSRQLSILKIIVLETKIKNLPNYY